MYLSKVLQVFSRWCPNSIRQLSLLSGKPYETTRRFIKGLSSEKARRAYAERVLRRWVGKRNVVVLAIDPTYTKGLGEGFLVASLIVDRRGRSIPLWWERFSWREMAQRGIDSRNLLQRRFLLRLKELVYPRKLVIIADREFGRKAFLRFLKKKGIYWVIRHPRSSWPPELGEALELPGPSEPYLISWRLPPELRGANPIKLYVRRMTIEETFRDAKGFMGLRRLLRRVKDPQVKEGLCFLVFASLALMRELAEEALRYSLSLFNNLPKGFLGLLRRGYYSITYLGWVCLVKGDKPRSAEGLWASLDVLTT